MKKLQIKYVLLGSIVGFGGGLTNFFLWYDIEILPVGNILVAFYTVFFSYAIIKYRLMDIRTIASNIFIYAILGIFACLSFIGSYFLGKYLLLSGKFDFTLFLLILSIFSIFFSALMTLLFKYSQKWSDKLFYGGRNPDRILKDLVIGFNKVLSVEDLSQALVKELKKIIRAKKLAIILSVKLDGKGDVKIYNKKDFLKLSLKQYNPLLAELNIAREIIVREEIKISNKGKSDFLDILEKEEISLLSPLMVGDQVIGAIIIGAKEDWSAYTVEDINVIKTLCSQVSVTFMNAYIHDNLRRLVESQTKDIIVKNEELEKKTGTLEKQAKELAENNAYMKKLLAMRSEFLDIASHQLRTPVSVIKGMLSMILEGGMPKDKVDEFLKASFSKSKKLAEIINDILRASEIDSEKVLLKFAPVDLNKLLSKLMEDKKIQSKDREIELTLILPEKPLPIITADDRYLGQAIENLINNSLQYTPKGGRVEVRAGVNGKIIEIRVSDTGIGIPAAEIPKLFSKFTRAKNAIAMYTDGTGLGLYIVRKIIEEHKDGKVLIEKTKEGEGTTFLITLASA
jgi:signal transduction histidine kinase